MNESFVCEVKHGDENWDAYQADGLLEITATRDKENEQLMFLRVPIKYWGPPVIGYVPYEMFHKISLWVSEHYSKPRVAIKDVIDGNNEDAETEGGPSGLQSEDYEDLREKK